jgi:hypothetical protein
MGEDEMRQVSFELVGFVVGSIWWPAGAECFKPLSYDISREDGRFSAPADLRTHVLAATNDGDFQSCSIADGRLIATIERQSGTSRVTRTREFPLSMFPSVADCLHPDADWLPDYGEE